MAQQVSSTIASPTPRHRVNDANGTRRAGTRRPGVRRPEGGRPARGPQVQRADRGLGFETRGVTAGCRVQRPDARQPQPRLERADSPTTVTRLTDRGIAVVLTLGALLGLVAVFCIVVTGLRVTAEPAAQQAVPAASVSAPAQLGNPGLGR